MSVCMLIYTQGCVDYLVKLNFRQLCVLVSCVVFVVLVKKSIG